MKVLQINSVCSYGSTGRIAVDLYTLLESQGHECMIAYGRRTAPANVKTIRIGSSFDNYRHVALTRLTDKHGFSSRNATKKLIEDIEGFDPDIIHLHNIHGYFINMEILFHYLSQANKPVVWTLHDCWAFAGHCSYFDYVQCDKWKSGCFDCPQKGKYPKSLVRDNSAWNYHEKMELFTSIQDMKIVTPSQWLADLVKQSYLKKYPVNVIHNGINLDAFKPTSSDFKTRYHIENKKVVLGVASVWEDRKGLKYLEKLSADLGDEYAVVIVGVTESQKKHLANTLIGITRTNSIQELAGIYSAADVFVNPTMEDNFPTTNIEALACGTPVITFQTGGSPECIDETCGIVVGKGDADALYSAVKSIENKPFTKEACLKRSLKFNKSERFLEYIALYQDSNKQLAGRL